MFHALGESLGVYRCPNKRLSGRVAYTHTVPAGAFRGYGLWPDSVRGRVHAGRARAAAGHPAAACCATATWSSRATTFRRRGRRVRLLRARPMPGPGRGRRWRAATGCPRRAGLAGRRGDRAGDARRRAARGHIADARVERARRRPLPGERRDGRVRQRYGDSAPADRRGRARLRGRPTSITASRATPTRSEHDSGAFASAGVVRRRPRARCLIGAARAPTLGRSATVPRPRRPVRRGSPALGRVQRAGLPRRRRSGDRRDPDPARACTPPTPAQ